jgi:uncharacterized membrane protein
MRESGCCETLFDGFYLSITIKRRNPMTQHLSPEDTAADRRAMRQLATVIGIFFVATAILALTVGLIMG